MSKKSQPLQLEINRNIFNDAFYPLLFDYTHRWETYKGSAGSGKSHFISQKLVLKALNDPGRRILICRRYGSTITHTVWQLINEQLDDNHFKIAQFCKINKTERSIQLPNGSQFIFFGLDEETKLLSLQNISDIWIEEAFEVPRDIVDQLNLRLRGTKKNQQIIMSFNPISKSSWLYEFCELNRPKSFMYHQSTYKDNKFLPTEYVEALEDMIRTNPKKAQVFVYGDWGVDLDGLVYPNHRVENFDIQELLRNEELRVMCGCDIGFTDPSTICVSLWDKKNRKIYVISEYYQRGAIFEEIAQGIINCGVGKNKIFIDNADPRAIRQFTEYGFNARPAKKGNDSIRAYMTFLQNHEIIVHESCTNMIMELDNFSFVKNHDTGMFDPGKTTHEYSHLIDALRYSFSDVFKEGRMRTVDLKWGL